VKGFEMENNLFVEFRGKRFPLDDWNKSIDKIREQQTTVPMDFLGIPISIFRKKYKKYNDWEKALKKTINKYDPKIVIEIKAGTKVEW
jgi:hypothetical protein